MVHFGAERKIQQVRLYWDQGSLLKQIEIIGARGRNWPIRDGKDQARLIATSVASARNADVNRSGAREPRPRDPEEVVIRSQSPAKRGGGSHASSSLFAPAEADPEQGTSRPAVIATRASAKPPPRDYQDLFVGQGPDSANATAPTSQSPLKDNRTGDNAIAPKGGTSKNFQPSRLFDNENMQPGTPGSPLKFPDAFKKPHPKKYDHFELADGSNEPTQQGQPRSSALPARPKNKHQSQWDFEDFVTPEKVPMKIRAQDVRHFGLAEGEGVESPLKQPKLGQPRRDAQTHFEFRDDGETARNRQPGPPRGQGQNHGLQLYQNNLYGEEDPSDPTQKSSAEPLKPVTNVKDRQKDFEPHFALADNSPSTKQNGNHENKVVPENRRKAVQMMDSSWGNYDQSPENAKKPVANDSTIDAPTNDTKPAVQTGGDGMGGKRGTGRSWNIGDDGLDEHGVSNQGKFVAGKRQQAPKANDFWDF